MSSEWKMVRLGDHVDACLGKMLDAKKNKGTPQPYLGNSNVRWGNFDLAGLAEMRFEPHEEARYSLLPGDLVVCEGGEPGRCAIWCGAAGMKIQKALHRIRPKKSLDNYYLFYWFQLAARSGLLEPYFTGTTIKHLTGKAIAALQIPLPPISTQRVMVDVLKQLDDRITLLRETNATLEAIAQALFKSWFVDFDPVRANIAAKNAPEGAVQGSASAAQDTTAGMPEAGQRREPLPTMPAAALDAATAALFPDSFEESELGLVPKGWRVGSLSDVCTIASGKRPPDRSDNSTEVCSIPLYGGAGLMGYTSASLFDETLIVTGRVGTLGKVHIAYPPFWASDNVLVVSPKSPSAFSFALNWIRSIDVQALNRGSTQPLLTQRDLGAQQGMIPSREVLHKFEEIVGRLYERIRSQEQQAQTLTQLRDTLLPRLIAGTLRLPEAC